MNKFIDHSSAILHIESGILNLRQLFIVKSSFGTHAKRLCVNCNQHDHMTRFLLYNKSLPLKWTYHRANEFYLFWQIELPMKIKNLNGKNFHNKTQYVCLIIVRNTKFDIVIYFTRLNNYYVNTL